MVTGVLQQSRAKRSVRGVCWAAVQKSLFRDPSFFLSSHCPGNPDIYGSAHACNSSQCLYHVPLSTCSSSDSKQLEISNTENRFNSPTHSKRQESTEEPATYTDLYLVLEHFSLREELCKRPKSTLQRHQLLHCIRTHPKAELHESQCACCQVLLQQVVTNIQIPQEEEQRSGSNASLSSELLPTTHPAPPYYCRRNTCQVMRASSWKNT